MFPNSKYKAPNAFTSFSDGARGVSVSTATVDTSGPIVIIVAPPRKHVPDAPLNPIAILIITAPGAPTSVIATLIAIPPPVPTSVVATYIIE